jgi:septum formation protein
MIMKGKYPVVLASASPRRKELLARLFETFEIVQSAVDEDSIEAPAESLARVLAEAKAADVFKQRSDNLVIGCDTTVALDGKLFGKPRSEGAARAMLEQLSGKSHEVITGVCLMYPDGRKSLLEISTVTFRKIEPEEIDEYVRTGEPMDKAGAYAIQGGAKKFAARIQGDIDNIIGLPVAALQRALEEIGYMGS